MVTVIIATVIIAACRPPPRGRGCLMAADIIVVVGRSSDHAVRPCDSDLSCLPLVVLLSLKSSHRGCTTSHIVAIYARSHVVYRKEPMIYNNIGLVNIALSAAKETVI